MNTLTFETDKIWTIISFLSDEEKKTVKINDIPINAYNKVMTFRTNGGDQKIQGFNTALFEKNVYVQTLDGKIIGEVSNQVVGDISIWIEGREIKNFENKNDVIDFVQSNIKKEEDVIVQFNLPNTEPKVNMMFEDFKKRNDWIIFKDHNGISWVHRIGKEDDWKEVEVYQLFPIIKLIGIFKEEAKKFLFELNQ